MDAHPEEVRLPAVERTVDVIQLLSYSSGQLTLSEICRALGIPKSSAHYLIQTLLARGFLFRNSDCRTYSIGLRVPELLNLSRIVQQLRTLLREDLCKLARKTCLTTVATVLRDTQAVVIEKLNPRIKEAKGILSSRAGRRIDAHCTAQGKIHLAYLTDTEFDNLLRGCSLPRFTPKTICSVESLRVHLGMVSSRGFAFNDQEHIIGVRGIAAPIFNHARSVVAAIGVSGSVEEISRNQISPIANEVVSAALESSRRFLDWAPADL